MKEKSRTENDISYSPQTPSQNGATAHTTNIIITLDSNKFIIKIVHDCATCDLLTS